MCVLPEEESRFIPALETLTYIILYILVTAKACFVTSICNAVRDFSQTVTTQRKMQVDREETILENSVTVTFNMKQLLVWESNNR